MFSYFRNAFAGQQRLDIFFPVNIFGYLVIASVAKQSVFE
jgi:hypothetical protein